jgi:hypothetical protein
MQSVYSRLIPAAKENSSKPFYFSQYLVAIFIYLLESVAGSNIAKPSLHSFANCISPRYSSHNGRKAASSPFKADNPSKSSGPRMNEESISDRETITTKSTKSILCFCGM